MRANSLDSPAAPEPDESAQPLAGHGGDGGNLVFRKESKPAAKASTSSSKFEVEISLSIPEPSGSPSSAAPAIIGADSKLEHLDGLRGIMCLVVVCDHWLMMGYYTRPNPAAHLQRDGVASPFFDYPLIRTPLRIFVAGEFAVATFFVLRCLFPPLVSDSSAAAALFTLSPCHMPIALPHAHFLHFNAAGLCYAVATYMAKLAIFR